MKSKSLISGVIVISIIVGLVIMFTSGSSGTDSSQQAAMVDNNKPVTEKQPEQKREEPTEMIEQTATAEKKQNKVAKKPKVQNQPKKQTASSEGSSSRVTRVRRPGQKFRMVRIEPSLIPPESELRKWSRDQWVTKVSSLQSQGKDSLAQDYITAYNTQYPGKDLNHYIK